MNKSVRLLHVSLFVLFVLIYGFFCMRYWTTIRDDTFIYYRYVNNVLAGNGPVFNPGEYTEGYTSPLWLIVLTIAAP